MHATGSGYHFDIRLDGLDHPLGAVSSEECVRFSRELAELIDQTLENRKEGGEADILPANLNPENYSMEVSSAGAERTLHLPEDLHRFQGRALRIKFVLEETYYTALALFAGKEEAVGGEEAPGREDDSPEDAPRYRFTEYAPRGKKKSLKKKSGGTAGSKRGNWSWEKATGEGLLLAENQIKEVNLYLDY